MSIRIINKVSWIYQVAPLIVSISSTTDKHGNYFTLHFFTEKRNQSVNTREMYVQGKPVIIIVYSVNYREQKYKNSPYYNIRLPNYGTRKLAML